MTFNGYSRRILGDFSTSSNFSYRTLFQSTTVNGYTAVGLIPNGTSNISSIFCYSSSDPNNCSFARVLMDGSASYVDSSQNGTGSYLPLVFRTSSTNRLQINVDGTIVASNLAGTGTRVVCADSTGLFTTSSVASLSGYTVDGTNPVGFRSIPQNSQSTSYTTVLTDSGKHIFHPSADTTARTFTIPANSSVSYDIGTSITFINQNAAGVITISTSDTMRLAGAGTTGNRTLAANGIATAIKVTATEWLINGSGLT